MFYVYRLITSIYLALKTHILKAQACLLPSPTNFAEVLLRPTYALMAIAALSLGAQEPKAERAPALPKGPTSLEIHQAVRDASTTKPKALPKAIVVPSLSVVVEGSAIQIPDPPEDVRLAKARLKDVQVHALSSLVFLDAQLKQYYQEQKEALEAAKSVPRTIQDGLGSSVHKELWDLVRDVSLKVGEQNLIKSIQAQIDLQKARAERDQDALETKSGLSTGDPLTHHFNKEQEDRDQNGSLRKTIAWQGDEFLKGFRPSWVAFAPKLEAYIQTSARLLLELESKPQAPSTKLLGRMLTLQLFERCRALIDLNLQIWNMSATKVLEPRNFQLAENRGWGPE